MNPIQTDFSLVYACYFAVLIEKKEKDTSGGYRTLQVNKFCNIKGYGYVLEANPLQQQVGNILNYFIKSIPFKQS